MKKILVMMKNAVTKSNTMILDARVIIFDPTMLPLDDAETAAYGDWWFGEYYDRQEELLTWCELIQHINVQPRMVVMFLAFLGTGYRPTRVCID